MVIGAKIHLKKLFSLLSSSKDYMSRISDGLSLMLLYMALL